MKLIGVILFASAAAATILKRQGNNSTVENPFAGLPDLSGLNLCTTECQTVFQTQKNPPSDWSTTCTPTFAAAVQGCLNCISTNVPALLLTDDVKKSVNNTLEIYLKNCVTLASTTEALTLPTALSPTGAQSSGLSSISTGSGTASSPSATKTSGAVADLKVQVPGVALAAALVGALATF